MAFQSPGSKLAVVHMHDWLVLLLLAAMDGVLNLVEPFHRYVGKEMMVDLMFPFKEDTIPMWGVPVHSLYFHPHYYLSCILLCQKGCLRSTPCNIGYYSLMLYFSLLLFYDFYAFGSLYHLTGMASLVWNLGLMFSSLITGVITDSIKDAVGRPRPNFFQRCFPDKIPVFLREYYLFSFDFIFAFTFNHQNCRLVFSMFPVFDKDTGDVICHGIKAVIKEGYKRSFAGLGFLSWYLSGKIRVFDRRGHIGKLCIVLLPLLIAALVGITRVDDYWHHWTDVFAGGIIGLTVSSICYLLLFPFPTLAHGWAPHAFFHKMVEDECSTQQGSESHASRLDELPLQMEQLESGTRYMIFGSSVGSQLTF
ncbi:putative lipid phosphate phosphatase 4, partial [Mucuna pruriens]